MVHCLLVTAFFKIVNHTEKKIFVRHVALVLHIHSLKKKHLQNQCTKYLSSVCMHLLEHYPTEIQDPILNY